jgi:pyruvate dehydrogenase E2 component (dihydrolipoamide acetyltransferase)
MGMAEAIIMPKLGADTTEGTLLNWTKNVGDTVKPGDVIAEIEIDKTSIEIAAEVSGVILQFLGNPGDTLQVGATIGYVGAAGESVGGAPAPAKAEAAATATATAAAGSGQTPAAAAAPVAPPPAAPAPESAPAKPAPVPEGNGNGAYPGGIKASPIARAIATEKGIDLRQVKGSGPSGRITRADVIAFTPPPAAATTGGIGGKPSYGKLPEGPDVEIIDMTKMRKLIGERMVTSKQQVPHFYVTTEIDTDALVDLRKQLNSSLDDASKISVNDMVVKAVALALRKFPNLNTHFYGDKLVRNKRINIGIAVALSNGGLMNVVAHDADKTSLGTMAVDNKGKIERALAGKVKPDDISGSTFTVSNLGMYGVEDFVAIINPPEAGILAVGGAKKIPVVKADGTLGVGTRMKVTVSVDHRVSDGAEGAQFLVELKKLIESPMLLLI